MSELLAAPAATSEEGLVQAARRGDEAAFAALVRAHQRRVFRLAGRFFRRPEEVEEVAQETFLRAWEKLSTYRAEAPFEHWLTRICLNCCYQRLRRRRPDEEELPDGEIAAGAASGGSEAGIEARLDARRTVERLLGRLSAIDRFILQLLHGEEWSVAEIAERLGWSRTNVKVRAHRARVRLRKLLEEEDPS